MADRKVEDCIYRRGSRYSVRVRVASGRQVRQSARTLADARALRDRLRHAANTNTYVERVDRDLTVRDYVERRYLPSRVWSQNMRKTRTSIIKRHVLPTFGDMRLGAVQPDDVAMWMTKLIDTGKSDHTITTYMRTLTGIFQTAADSGIRPTNPVKQVRRPKLDAAVHNVLSAAQVQRLAERIGERYALAVWIGAMAGLRLGETLGLTMADIDTTKGTIKVHRQMQANGQHSRTTKSGKRRDVPVPDLLVALIEAHVARWGVSSAGTLFSTPEGKPLAHRGFYALWASARDGMELPEDAQVPHSLRHFYASTLIDKGLNPKEIQARLGHASIKMTMDTYGHLFPESAENTKRAFDGVFAPQLAAA